MEQPFTLHCELQKKDFFEFGQIQTYRSNHWALIGLRVCAPLLMALYALLLLLNKPMPVVLIVGVVVLFLQAFAPELIGYPSYSASSKNGSPISYVITDEQVRVFTPTSESAVSYAGFTDAVETDRIFALFLNKNSAFVIPKDAFAPDEADRFRAFLAQKLGKLPRRVPSVGKKRFVYLGAVLVLSAALITGAFLLRSKLTAPTYTRNLQNNSTQTFSVDTYSISLPTYFSEKTPDTENGWALEISSSFVYISVFSETDDELLSAGYSPTMSTSAYLEDILEFYDLTPESIVTTDDGTAYCFTTAEFDGTTYCYCYAVRHGAGAFWCTEFLTKAALRSEYEPLFLEWAATIQVTPQD